MLKGTISYSLTFALAAVSAPLTFASDAVRLNTPYVAVADVLELKSPNITAKTILATPLFYLSEGEPRTLSADEIKSQLEARIPGLVGRLRALDDGLDRRFVYYAPTKRAEGCVRLTHPVPAGETITRKDVSDTINCDVADPWGWTYSSMTGALSYEADLQAGHLIPARSMEALPRYAAGAPFTLVSNVGPVRITRPVTLIEPVFEGGLVHVRTAQGERVVATLPKPVKEQP